jgi:tRNA acetyltransferase TAN1
MEIIQEVAKCTLSNYTVDLDDPDVFVLVEAFKDRVPFRFRWVLILWHWHVQSTFGVSIVEDYYWFQKSNVMELANAHNEPERFEKGVGRVQDKKQDDDNGTVLAMTAATLHCTGYYLVRLFNS